MTASSDRHASSNFGTMDSVPARPQAQVTLMNWSASPYNRWSFRNVGVAPSVMVPRSGDMVLLETDLDLSISTLCFEYQGKVHQVGEAMTGDGTDGIAVVKDGKIVFEEYFNGFGERDHHLWASCTKSLIALSMGILVGEGKVDTEEAVETYLPELKDTYPGKLVVRDILNMTSALDYTEEYENYKPGDVSTEYFRRTGFIPAFDLMAANPQKDNTPRGILEFLPRFEGNRQLRPGVRFEYQSPNADIAGWIIARVSGKPLQTFVADNLWNKLGVEHDAFFTADIGFNAIATGGFNTTLRDFARVGLTVMNNGRYNDHQVVPETWIENTFNLTEKERRQMQRSDYKDPEGPRFDEWPEGYKNFLWIHDADKRIATFRGIFGQHLYINQSDRIVIATFSSAESASNASRETNKPRLAAFDAIAAYLS